jgi:PAS domain S-box-containing protein
MNKNLAQLFDLLDTLPNPVTLNQLAYDEDGVAYDKIVYVNKNFLKMIGYTIEDIPSDRAWFTKAYPDEAYQQYISSEWFKAVEDAKANQTDLIGSPAKIRCKDGKDRWFSITTQLNHPISDKYRTIIFLHTDSPSEIQLKLDEKSLDLLNEKRLLKTIIDTAPIRIFWKDKEGIYLGCNQAFLNDAGLSNEHQIIGKSDYDMVWSENAQAYREDDRRVQESGVPELNFLERQEQQDGKYLMLSISKVPLINPSGETIGVLGLYQDITKEFKTQEELKEKDNLLLAQSRQAAMGEMISMIAHQWRQPLGAIAAVVSTIQVQRELGNSSMEQTTKQLEVISGQVEYLSRTISDFSNFFKRDKASKHVQPCEIIDNALMIIGKLLENNNIELHLSCLGTKPFNTFANELQHVFINLIKNSADALIENNNKEKWISISSEDDSKFITYEISDNAGGIDESFIHRIFEPYFSTKDEKNGTGLGLYMSKTIVEKHLRGSISCKNNDAGAVFTIKLPLV